MIRFKILSTPTENRHISLEEVTPFLDSRVDKHLSIVSDLLEIPILKISRQECKDQKLLDDMPEVHTFYFDKKSNSKLEAWLTRNTYQGVLDIL